MTITGNSNRTGYLPAASNLITITSSTGAVAFTLNSFRQITGTVGMPSTYKINSGSVVFPPRFDYNPTTLQPRGLLIEATTTNIALHSSDLTQVVWAKTNATVAKSATGPDGVAYSATTVTATAGNATALQTITATGAIYVSSAYIKRRTGTGTVQITQNGGTTWTAVTVTAGWTRVSTPLANITNPIVGIRIVTSGDAVDVAFFQTETLTEAPTSVIPTGASQVTRAADIALVTGTNFSSWYNQTQGSMVAAFSSTISFGSGTVYTVSDGTTSNRWTAGTSGSDINHSLVATTTQASINIAGYAPDAIFKSAFGVKLNSVQAAVNGVLGTQDTLATIPTVNRLNIGSSATSVPSFFGHIRSLTYYPARGSNAELQALSI
jgi:hypothetical protein